MVGVTIVVSRKRPALFDAAQRVEVSANGLARVQRVRAGMVKRGFSLLEVLLALALSVVVIAAIAMAVHLHLLTLQNQRAEVERAQLARAILQMIAADLRSAIQYKPADVSGLDELAASQQAMMGMLSGMGMDAGGQAAPGNDQPQASRAEDEILRPGIYGGPNQIAIDISRLPRPDQYLPDVTGRQVSSLPTDIKTVSYYVADQPPNAPAFRSPTAIGGQSGGLFRRQIDRAIASYYMLFGGSAANLGEPELIAPEVAQIGFRYFDGSQWVEQWDSDAVGGFPLAIEIAVVIDPHRASAGASGPYVFGGFDADQGMQVYRTVVFLPIAEILPEEP